MTVKKVLLMLAITSAVWGSIALPGVAATPVDGVLPVGDAPAAPALPELLAPAQEQAPPAPEGVAAEQCVADGGNVENMEDGSPGYHCEGGADDGMPVRKQA